MRFQTCVHAGLTPRRSFSVLFLLTPAHPRPGPSARSSRRDAAGPRSAASAPIPFGSLAPLGDRNLRQPVPPHQRPAAESRYVPPGPARPQQFLQHSAPRHLKNNPLGNPGRTGANRPHDPGSRAQGTRPWMRPPRRRPEEARTALARLPGQDGGRVAATACPPPGPGAGSRAAAGPLLGLGLRPLRRGREEVAVLCPQDSDGCRRGWRPGPAGNPGRVDAAPAGAGRRQRIRTGPGVGVSSPYLCIDVFCLSSLRFKI